MALDDKVARFETEMLRLFIHEPTECQRTAITMLSAFLFNPEPDMLFLLKGYAGTGKTTVISAFVKVLDAWRIRNRLLAPTGRAAKVLGQYAGKPAHTIHRFIYQVYTAPDGGTVIIPRQNTTEDTVFIVDEVSMISGAVDATDDRQSFGERNILDDLIRFVYGTPNCRMIFLGDTAQLPPVGTLLSPALDSSGLSRRFNLNVLSHSLETVVRQEAHSGILANATRIRQKIVADDTGIPFLQPMRPDVSILNGQDLLDELSGSFTRYDLHSTVLITRSNKRANMYNQEIRRRILFREYEIEGGDLMMVVKNNYFWLPPDSPAGFIANGDLVEILRVRNMEERYGFRFADALVRLVDYPDQMELELKLLLSTISSEHPSLSRPEQTRLFHAVVEEIRQEEPQKGKTGVSAHPYYNALQVKFAYALTCHKTQGGQWEKVFIDQGWLPQDKIDTGFLRWIYTAVSRATKKLFLIGFSEQYLMEEPRDD